MFSLSKTLAALLLCSAASLAQAAETAICYNCPSEWADWGTQLKAIAD
ncbi:ABC transporter substrate-binding protein, partial [Pseudomonas syringae pv. actinidiae]